MANNFTTYLLDVNVLLALFDPHHIAHDLVHGWMESIANFRWASCPITENGFIRIVTSPKYTNIHSTTEEAISRLSEFMEGTQHYFWSDSLSFTDSKYFSFIKPCGSKQLTDIYLVGLAHKNKGKLATLDKRIRSDFTNQMKYEPITLVE
jgi:uncharacterized protein